MATGESPERYLKVRIYLQAKTAPWSKEQTEALLDDLSTFLVDRGLGNTGGDDGPVTCVIAVGDVELSGDASDFMDEVQADPTGMIIFPGASH